MFQPFPLPYCTKAPHKIIAQTTPVSSLLFFLGVLFGYYVICPLSINFLGTYQVSNEVHNDFDLSSYIGLIRSSVLASGLVFELPIIIYFLTKVGLVTPAFLIKYRKYALGLSGTEDVAETYRKFRGTDPKIEPLLIKRGLK